MQFLDTNCSSTNLYALSAKWTLDMTVHKITCITYCGKNL